MDYHLINDTESLYNIEQTNMNRTLNTPEIFNNPEQEQQAFTKKNGLKQAHPRRSRRRTLDNQFIKASLRNMVRETKSDRGLTSISDQYKPISHQAMLKFEEVTADFMKKLTERAIAFAEMHNEPVVSPRSMTSAAQTLQLGIENFFQQFLVPRDDGPKTGSPQQPTSYSYEGDVRE